MYVYGKGAVFDRSFSLPSGSNHFITGSIIQNFNTAARIGPVDKS
jgi:hypothetical protein